MLISFERLEYTVFDSEETISANVSITSASGWAVPLQFVTVTPGKIDQYLFPHFKSHTGLAGINNSAIISIPAQYPDPFLTFEVTIDLADDNQTQLPERFSVSLQLLTPLIVSDDSNLTTTIIVIPDNGIIESSIIICGALEL